LCRCSGDDRCGSGNGADVTVTMDCWHDSAGASECQQKEASVIVDGMGCSGGWKMTTAATKHSIHSRIYYLLSVPQIQRSNHPNHKPATAAAKPAGGLKYHWHMHITRNNNKGKQWVNSRHKHCITSQASRLPAVAVGGSLDCAGRHA
jgi:hypothetical protein